MRHHAAFLLTAAAALGCASNGPTNGGASRSARHAAERDKTTSFESSAGAKQMALENEAGVYEGRDIEETMNAAMAGSKDMNMTVTLAGPIWVVKGAPGSADYGRFYKAAVEKGFGKKVLVVPSLGGTTPDFVFTRLLGLPSIVIPLAPYDENNHAPNESTKVSLYLAGVRSGISPPSRPASRAPALGRESSA